MVPLMTNLVTWIGLYCPRRWILSCAWHQIVQSPLHLSIAIAMKSAMVPQLPQSNRCGVHWRQNLVMNLQQWVGKARFGYTSALMLHLFTVRGYTANHVHDFEVIVHEVNGGSR